MNNREWQQIVYAFNMAQTALQRFSKAISIMFPQPAKPEKPYKARRRRHIVNALNKVKP